MDARTGFVRLRGKDLTLEIVVTGCTGGGIVDLLNIIAIIVEGQALRANLVGRGRKLSRAGKNNFEMRGTAAEQENPREV